MIVIKINYASVLPFVNVSYEQSNVYAKVVYGTGTEWGDISGTLSNQTDLQNALNAKQNTLTLTTTGTSGASTLIGSTLNIPQYADAVTSVFGRTGAIVSTEGDYTLTQLGDVTLTSPTNGQVLKYNGTTWVNNTDTDTGLTSVGLTMPSAFTVSNSPLTSNGTIGVTGAGTSAQYIRGDGQLANFPSNGGGGSAFNYYLNGSVTQGTFGGDVYYEMSKIPVIGGGTNFTRTNAQGNGYIASFLTDAGDPSLLNIPGGNWNLEFYFQASASGGSPQFYGELYKVSASNVFTLVASGSTNPEGITNGTTVDQYFTSIPVPQTSLLVTDRLAIRIYVITDGRTITLHTENSNLCEVLTTFSTGLNALNGLTAQVQYFATGTSGTDFAISSATDTHTFNLPTASATNRGALSSADWTTFNNKQNTITNPVTGTGTTNYVARWTSGSDIGVGVLYDNGTNVGIGTTSPAYKLNVSGSAYSSLGLITQGYTLAASGFNIEMGTISGYAQINAYNRTTSAFGSLRLDGSNIMLNSGSGGNVLIGTTTDGGQKLQVTGTAKVSSSVTASRFISNSSSSYNNDFLNTNIGTVGQNIALRFGYDGTTYNKGALYFISKSANGVGDLIFALNNAENSSNVATSDERMRITSGGNVLIGTTTDAGEKLQVTGTAKVSEKLNANAAFSNTAGAFALAMNGNYTGLRTGIDGSFNVDVFKPGTGYINPLKIVDTGAATFSSSVTASQFLASNSNGIALSDNIIGGFLSYGYNSSRTNAAGHNFYNGISTELMRITSSGNVGINTTNPTSLISVFIDSATIPRVGRFVQSNSGSSTIGALQSVNAAAGGSAIDAGHWTESQTSWIFRGYGNVSRVENENVSGSGSVFKFGITASGVVVIGTASPNASAILQTDSTTKGFLPPRMTTTQKNAITTPPAGLQVYDTTLNQMSYYNGTTWVNF